MKSQKDHKHYSSGIKNLPKTELLPGTDRWKCYIALAIIIGLSFISYLPVFQNSLLAWDDHEYITDNPLIYSLNLKDIFSRNVMGNYHPITVLTFALEYQLFGLNPSGYHAFNLLLHLLNVVLVFYTIFLLSDKITVALVASLLFGIHPLHVESVAWAAELKDLLYTFFFLASYIFYLKYLKDPQKKYYVFALFLFLISLLSKAMAASLPLVFILTDYFKGRKINLNSLAEKAPFFLLAIAFGIVAVYAQQSSGATALTNFTFPQHLLFASYGFISYLFKLLLPLNLSSFYPYPLKSEGIPVEYYAYFLLSVILVAYTIYSRRFTKRIIFGIGFFTITVLLVLQLLPVGKAIMADRYSYIPSIGIFYLAGEGFILLWNKKSLKYPAILLLSVSTVLFSIKTYSRCGVWKDDLTLWNDVIVKDQNVVEAYYNRGILFLEEKRNDEAVNDFNKVIELEPNYANSYNGKGIIFTNEGKYTEAIREFNKSIKLNPDYPDAYNNRGTVYMKERRNAEAFNDFDKAIDLKPDYANAYHNRGSIFYSEGKNIEALRDINKAIALNPHNAEAYNTRGSVFVSEGKKTEAISDFNKAIELKPDYSEAYYNRGSVFTTEGRNAEAINDFNRAIELNPVYANAYNNRGIVFVNEKRNAEAIGDFNKVIELKPDLANAYNNRGIVFVNEKRNTEAIKDFKMAVELNPGYLSAYNSMGNLFFEEKKYEDAIAMFTKVIALKSNYAQAYFKRGLSEFYSGKKEGACSDLRQAASLGYKPAVEALSQLCR